MEVGAIKSLGHIPSISDVGSSSGTNGIDSFKDVLSKVLEETNSAQNDSSALTQAMASGMTDNIQQVMIAGEKANILLQLTMQIRTKVLDAYTEIMRMQI